MKAIAIVPGVGELSLRAGEAVAMTMTDAVRSTGRWSLVLSGGSTPRTLYGVLAARFRGQIPWAHVHVFWGDERYVPLGDGRSNYRMAKEKEPLLPTGDLAFRQIFPALQALIRRGHVDMPVIGTLHRSFPESRFSGSIITSGKSPFRTWCTLASPTRFSRRSGTASPSRACR
jgi:hypothetical protein